LGKLKIGRTMSDATDKTIILFPAMTVAGDYHSTSFQCDKNDWHVTYKNGPDTFREDIGATRVWAPNLPGVPGAVHQSYLFSRAGPDDTLGIGYSNVVQAA
jgi:hypothetical protein